MADRWTFGQNIFQPTLKSLGWIRSGVQRIHFDRPVKVVVVDVKDIERRNLLLGDEPFDIIIDDGSHHSDDIIQAFRSLFDKLRPGGVYSVEDLHASYWESLGGVSDVPGRQSSFSRIQLIP